MSKRNNSFVVLVVSVLSALAMFVPVSASAQPSPPVVHACVPAYRPHFGVTITPQGSSIIYHAWGPSRVVNITTTIDNNPEGQEVWDFTDNANSVLANLGLNSPGIWSTTPNGSTYGRFTITTVETTDCDQKITIVKHLTNHYDSGGVPEARRG
jgi:hypothetical protein